MKILAWDGSADPRSVALLEQRAGEEPTLLVETEAPGQRSAALLQVVERILREAGWRPADVTALAVGLGPGSYTGIRAALALAQGWHLARGVPVHGAGSVEAIAARAWAAGWRGRTRVVVDAQRRELYVAGFALEDAGWREVEPLRLEPVETLQQRADRSDWLWTGPEVTRWFPEGRVLGPSAAWVARLALRTQPRSPEAWEPIYLRPVQFVKTAPTREITR